MQQNREEVTEGGNEVDSIIILPEKNLTEPSCPGQSGGFSLN